jgi:hypothetical protein
MSPGHVDLIVLVQAFALSTSITLVQLDVFLARMCPSFTERWECRILGMCYLSSYISLLFLVLCSAGQTYSEFRFTHYPSLTPLITAYGQGTDPKTSLGPHWQQPGRSILDNHMLAVPDASSVVPGAFTEFERIFFAGAFFSGQILL